MVNIPIRKVICMTMFQDHILLLLFTVWWKFKILCTFSRKRKREFIAGGTMSLQVRNQESFREREFSWNQGTSINITFNTRKKDPAWKKSLVFCLETLKNFTDRWPQSGYIFSKLGHFFSNFENGQERPPPSRPLPPRSSYVPVLIILCSSIINVCKFFWWIVYFLNLEI